MVANVADSRPPSIFLSKDLALVEAKTNEIVKVCYLPSLLKEKDSKNNK